ARSDTCLGQDCSFFDNCFVTRARRRAFESDVLVVNHALLFSNLALRTDEIGSVLPDFSILILDEAHEVEDVAAEYFGRQISNYQIDELCRDTLRAAAASPSIVRSLDKVRQHSTRFFDYWPAGEGRFSINFHRGAGRSRIDLREDGLPLYQKLHSALSTLSHQLARVSPRPAEIDALQRRLDSIVNALEDLFQMEDPEHVYWYERRGRGVFLHRTPIEVAPLLRDCLFQSTDTVVLISATLTASGSFDYVCSRLGVDGADELVLPGEFDYSRQAVLYVPSRMPEPRSPEFFLRALQQIRSILKITDGYAFLLFTSFQQMEKVYQALERSGDYPLFKQGDMPRNLLLGEFRETPRAVLCATSSFWQGVDVQGDALRAVVIDKLPFRVPTEPVVAARLHRIDRKGGDSFLEYSVPEAVIALRQGLGRLIRSRQDRGILAVLDGRLRTRRYGRLFLESLPNCRLTDNIMELKNFYSKNVSIISSGE
ncbi:MAG TPA: helicase C-terminal domain-containing protein, partial [Acidobacteriota bacterium]|nr:helicase C-terminal domain-containing protein [Acidobacteriota bacterium]